jgi:hypothetical protein
MIGHSSAFRRLDVKFITGSSYVAGLHALDEEPGDP